MNIYFRILFPTFLYGIIFAVLGIIILALSFFENPSVFQHSSWMIIFITSIGLLFLGLPYSIRLFRIFRRYCQLKDLKLSNLTLYSPEEIDAIRPTLEQLDDNAKVYFDEYVQEHYFECPELKEFQWRDRIKISEYQHYRAMIGKLSKEKLLAKARKKSQHRWHQRSDS